MAELPQEGESKAYAKAVLITAVANAASAMKLDTTAQALLLHLMADTRPDGKTWSADTPLSAIATRMGVHRATAQRAADSVRRIVSYCPGRGSRRAKWTVRLLPNVAPALQPDDAPAQQWETPNDAPMQHPMSRECRAGATSDDAPARRIPRDKRIPRTTTIPPAGAGGGGEGLDELLNETEQKLIAAGCSPADAARLAADPEIDECRVEFALQNVKARKPERPGAYLSKLLTMPERELEGYGLFKAKWEGRLVFRARDRCAAAAPSEPDPFVLPRGEKLAKPVNVSAMLEEGRARRKLPAPDTGGGPCTAGFAIPSPERPPERPNH